MSFLTKLAKAKILRDEGRFLFSAQAATVTLSWKVGNTGGAFNDLFKQHDGGEDKRAVKEWIKAEKIIITPATISTYVFGDIKIGDVIFRFSRGEDLSKPELVVTHLEVDYYPIIFSPEQQEILTTSIGDDHIFQTLICSRIKGRSGIKEEVGA